MSTDPALFMVSGGLNDVQAQHLADMFDAGNVSADRLCRDCQMPDFMATEVARQLNARVIDTLRLQNFAVLPEFGVELLRAVTEKRE